MQIVFKLLQLSIEIQQWMVIAAAEFLKPIENWSMINAAFYRFRVLF